MRPNLEALTRGGFGRLAEIFVMLRGMTAERQRDAINDLCEWYQAGGQRFCFETRRLDAGNTFDFPTHFTEDGYFRGAAVSIQFNHLSVLPEIPGLRLGIGEDSLIRALEAIGKHIFDYYGYLNEEHVLFLAAAVFSVDAVYSKRYAKALFGVFPEESEYTEDFRKAFQVMRLSHHQPCGGEAMWLLGVALQCGVPLDGLVLFSQGEDPLPLPKIYLEKIAEWQCHIAGLQKPENYFQTRAEYRLSPC